MKQIQGFTVVELMIAVAIAGILMVVGIPSFLSIIERNAIATSSNEILNGILLARSESTRQETTLHFTSSATGWQVTDGVNNLLDQASDNTAISISASDITYTPRGRADPNTIEPIEVSYKGTIMSRVCISLTGRPYIKSAEDGNCP